jgi:hypothetical protein
MASKHLTRQQRGMQLAMQTVARWQPTASGVRMPSQSHKGAWYTVTTDTCDCHDAEYNVCKHQYATRILLGRLSK